jgi:bile acid:Na+ symporter, BASS family
MAKPMLRFLAFLGRNGTIIMAVGFFIGLAAPPLAALLRPLLSTFVFLLTAASMLAVDWPALVSHLRRPFMVAMVLAWAMIGAPILTAAGIAYAGLPVPLGKALVVWSASPPLIAVPAVAALLGLDPALALLVMVAGTFLTPLTLPPLVLGLIGVRLDIGILALTGNLAVFILGAAALAAVARRLIGPARITAHKFEVNGLAVLLLLLFVVAVMDGVARIVLARPGEVLLYAAAAMVTSLVLQAVSYAVFARLERRAALTAGLIGGNHNIAVVWASLGAGAAHDLVLFLAIVQFPIFVLPALVGPIYRRLAGAPAR